MSTRERVERAAELVAEAGVELVKASRGDFPCSDHYRELLEVRRALNERRCQLRTLAGEIEPELRYAGFDGAGERFCPRCGSTNLERSDPHQRVSCCAPGCSWYRKLTGEEVGA